MVSSACETLHGCYLQKLIGTVLRNEQAVMPITFPNVLAGLTIALVPELASRTCTAFKKEQQRSPLNLVSAELRLLELCALTREHANRY